MKSNKASTLITLRIPVKVHKKFKTTCRHRCSNMTAVINQMIEDYLSQDKDRL